MLPRSPSPTPRPARPLVAVLLAGALLAAPSARASQYSLDQAAAIVTPDEARHLRRAGVRHTGDFLTWGRTPEGRSLLARRAHLPLEHIETWTMMADLMRVRGIGPDVARLLYAVGVRDLDELRRADAQAAADAIRDFNKKFHYSTNPPRADSISYWIKQAHALPLVLVAPPPPPSPPPPPAAPRPAKHRHK